MSSNPFSLLDEEGDAPKAVAAPAPAAGRVAPPATGGGAPRRSANPKSGGGDYASYGDYGGPGHDYAKGHACSIKEGFEPNYEDSEECSTYWEVHV